MVSEKYNLAVIGAGSGGLVCAAGASGLGAKVVLIEKHKMGGDCLNTGCVPSKALIKSAKMASLMKHASDYGLQVDGFRVNFREVMERVRSIQAIIEPHDSPERFRGLGVDVQFGLGHFVSPFEVSNGVKNFSAKRFVIATGSRPSIPKIPGLLHDNVLTSENIWDIRTLPSRLVVVGGGPIGTELAQCFSRFGSQVFMISNTNRILPRDDEDASKLLMEVFNKEGIKLYLNAKTKQVVQRNGKNFLVLDCGGREENVEYDSILIAAGRLPNLEGLGLDKAGVSFNNKGITVDDTLRTNQKHIYACGDVAGPYLFTHTADYQARLVLRNAFFPGKSKTNYRVVPWCTYSDPEVAQCGLTISEAKKLNIEYEVTTYPLEKLDRAICDGDTKGFVKVLTTKGSDEIIGVTMVGEHAGDLMHEFVLAMKAGIGLKQISQTIHAYPTLAEAPRRTADEWMRRKLTPTVKRIFNYYFRWLRG